jgi:NTP pyrophosphatase (non-canonical NTP hydrolase)
MTNQPNEISMPISGEGLSLGDAQALVDHWIKTVGVRYFSELTNTAVLMEEVGELARLMSRSYGDQSFKAGEKQGSEALGEEMADVLFVLICLANQTGVDLTEAFQKSMEKKTKRDSDRHKSNPKLG